MRDRKPHNHPSKKSRRDIDGIESARKSDSSSTWANIDRENAKGSASTGASANRDAKLRGESNSGGKGAPREPEFG